MNGSGKVLLWRSWSFNGFMCYIMENPKESVWEKSGPASAGRPEDFFYTLSFGFFSLLIIHAAFFSTSRITGGAAHYNRRFFYPSIAAGVEDARGG